MSDMTTCVVVGGGPAGMVTGLLLARAGVEVTVLEKHGDFLRDFRGDTVHPTTLQLLDDLGLIQDFDAIAHTRLNHLTVLDTTGTPTTVLDLGRLRTRGLRYRYLAMVPQWDLLDLIAAAARRESTFRLVMAAEVIGLCRDGGRVTGVRYRTPDGEHTLRADLTIAADGRSSRVRELSGLPVRSARIRTDVWWFRISTAAPVADGLLPRADGDKRFIVIPREGYVQVGCVIPKGADARLRAQGIGPVVEALYRAMPELRGSSVPSLDEVNLLDVQVNRLRRWYRDGLLCIGDAAHAMSPIGGVGINLAIQDAVAAANRLAGPLRAGELSRIDLRAVQRRRAPAAIPIQWLQRLLDGRLAASMRMTAPGSGGPLALPVPVARLLRRIPSLTRIPARVLLVGLRPERAPIFARRASIR